MNFLINQFFPEGFRRPRRGGHVSENFVNITKFWPGLPPPRAGMPKMILLQQKL
jgi:hypothetical protein